MQKLNSDPDAQVVLHDVRVGSFAEGRAFGPGRLYEIVNASAQVTVDPVAPRHHCVLDLANAQRDEDGKVRCRTDVMILRPEDHSKGNGCVLFEFVNRGNKRFLQFFNDGFPTNEPVSSAHAGNGFLMEQGFTIVIVAWQADVLPGNGRICIDVPPIVIDELSPQQTIRCEFIADMKGVTCLPLSGKPGTRSYPAVSLDTRAALLRRRRYPSSEPERIAPDTWQFARVEGGTGLGAGDVSAGEQAIVASRSHVYLPGGFEPGWIYELVYTATAPIALDMGFLAVREVMSFLRYDTGAGNPLAARLPKHAIAWGRSQSGRAIRDFVYRGFNDAGDGRRVFDGVLPHVSGAGKTLFHRFANMVIPASRQYEDWLNPADRFPFSYASSVDHITGVQDAILTRPATDPLVIHTQTGSEYWYRRGSLVHTDTRGNDLVQPDTVRIYFWSSSQHWSDPRPAKPGRGPCENFQNIVSTVAFFRATLLLMQRWITDGIAPPPSRIPKRADATLVPFDAWRAAFPAIPGVKLPYSPNVLPYVDYGPELALGGPIAEPPIVSDMQIYAVLVPATDIDGNDVAGLRAPMVEAPLGTYTGWNIRLRGHGHGALHDFSGSYLPFPETVEEAGITGDPRAPITARYGSAQGYAEAIRGAALALIQDGLLLSADVERITAQAAGYGEVNHVHQMPGQ